MAGKTQTALVLVANPVTGDSRVLRAADTLRDLGFAVTIVGATTRKELATEAEIDGFRVIRLTRLDGFRRWSRRQSASTHDADSTRITAVSTRREARFPILRRLAWAASFYLQGIALIWRTSPTLVHANDYTTMWIGLAAKLLRHSHLVYDSHELWPDHQGRQEWRPWLIACEWLFVRVADAVVTVSTGCAEVLAMRYRIPTPVIVRNVRDPMTAACRPVGLRVGAHPLAVYVGGLIAGRGIEQAIDALAHVPEARLRLMGPGSADFSAAILRRASAVGVADRVELLPAVPSHDLVETIAVADIGVVLTQPLCLNNLMSLPNKLFEYSAAGLPLVASDLPVIGAIVRENGLGEAVPPTDVDAIAAALRRLSDPERNAAARQRVRVFAERNTWARERLLLEDVYRSVTGDDDG